MEVLSVKTVSEKDAAKLLHQFVDAKESEENADLMMNDEVKFQLAQVLEHLEGKQKKKTSTKKTLLLAADDEEPEDDE